MTDQAQAVEGDALTAMMNVLEAEETQSPEPEEIEEQAAEPVENTEDETEETAEVEEPTEEITWNGETKVLTKSELKSLAQQGFDYTQKTQQVAEERRSFQAQQQAFQAQVAIHTQLSEQVAEIKSLDNQIAQYKGIDWASLAENDPQQYLKLNHAYREIKDARDAKASEYNQHANYLAEVQAQNHAQIKQSEMKLLSQKVPALVGERSAENQAELAQYLQVKGFNEAEIQSILDHRMLDVAWDAMQFRKLKSAKPEINKRVADAPKVVKNKTPTNPQVNTRNELKEKLRKTGDQNVAAKLIESML